MKKTIAALLLFAATGTSMPIFAAEPSLHEVYQAANSGKVEEAQRMMKEVLHSHPNSGKAHYVEAELLTRQGNTKEAANELATAEKLAPGLPFATQESVSSLRNAVSRHESNARSTASAQQQRPELAPQPTQAGFRFPWTVLAIGLGVVVFILWASRLMTRRHPVATAGMPQTDFGHYRPAYTGAPYGGAPQAYGTPAASPATGSGMGSQLLGGLATGAAVGAGVVAGEALMHHFMEGNKPAQGNDRAFSGFDDIPELPSTPLNDMGGNDFGISNGSSWDDGNASDDDWN